MPHTPCARDNKEYESRLTEARLHRGLKIKEVCLLSGINQQAYSSLNNGMLAPIDHRTGKVTEAAKQLSLVLEYPLEDLFPRYFCKIVPDDAILNEQILWIFHPEIDTESFESKLDRKDIRRLLGDLLRSLSPNNRRIVEYFIILGLTLDEVGTMLNLSRERVRQRIDLILDDLRKKCSRLPEDIQELLKQY